MWVPTEQFNAVTWALHGAYEFALTFRSHGGQALDGHIPAPCQQTRHGDVLVEFLRMQAAARHTDPVSAALLRCGIQQTGEPGKGNAESSSIRQFDPHGMVVKAIFVAEVFMP